MNPPTHPPARSRDARGTCVQIPAILQTLLLTLLLTLLAALLRHPRALAFAWNALAAHDADSWPHDEDDHDEEEKAHDYTWTDGQYWAPLTHNHADCDPRILYVIGPRPNRGLNPLPRALPTPCPETARAPPRRTNGRTNGRTAPVPPKPPRLSASLRPCLAFFQPPQPRPPTHAPFIPLSY